LYMKILNEWVDFYPVRNQAAHVGL
jgi:hypothetical protein